MTAALRCDDCHQFYDPKDSSHHQDGSESFRVTVDGGVLGETDFDLCSPSCLSRFATRRGPASRFTVEQTTPLSSLDRSAFRAIQWGRANIEQVRAALDDTPMPTSLHDELTALLEDTESRLATVVLDMTRPADTEEG